MILKFGAGVKKIFHDGRIALYDPRIMKRLTAEDAELRRGVGSISPRSSAFSAVHSLAILVFLVGPAFSATARAAVISEIHYHPPLGDEGLEFIEIGNDSTTPEDISGWSFVEGIDFTFPAGTILEGRAFIVVAADTAAIKARHGIQNVVGNFTGVLDGSGERVTLVNHAGIVVQSLRYRDGGKWPVGPDGAGHSLVLRSLRLDPREPESWTQSPKLGGSPGVENFPAGQTVEETAIVERGVEWRYAKGTGPFSAPPEAWLAPGFNDAGWLRGPSGFGYGDNDDATVLTDMQGSYTSIACRLRFPLGAADLAGAGDFYFAIDYDDGFCAYLNGRELIRMNRGAVGEIPLYDATADGSHEAGTELYHRIPADRLVEGENVLAVAGFNQGSASGDFSLIPRVVRRRTKGGGLEIVEEVLIGPGASWRLLKGTGPFSSPEGEWLSAGFNDSGWTAAASGFGFRRTGPSVVAYQVPASMFGNQDFGGSLGMDFDVAGAIVVTRLGVFDSGSDGLALPLSARLYNRSTGVPLASLAFSPESPGDLVEGSRFKDLPSPVNLPAGFQGTIVADGYGAGEPNGNQGVGPIGLATADGGGAIVFVGGGRFGAAPGSFPDSVDGGPPDRYAAGTFAFHPAGAGEGVIEAPPRVSTLLSDMPGLYTSIACRTGITLAAEDLDASWEYTLGVEFDDGFCAFLNGAEAARANCGTAGEIPVWNGIATSPHAAGIERFFPIPGGLLREGMNVLAIAGFSTGGDDSGMALVPRLLRRRIVQGTGGVVPVVFNEMFRGNGGGVAWVELQNTSPGPSGVAADLSGYALTDEPGRADPFIFAEGTVIPAGGFLVVTAAESGLRLAAPKVQLWLIEPSGIATAASTFDRASPPAAPGGFSECRFPDGGPLEWISLTPTPGAANRVERTDSIVINEIFYHAPDNRPDEFVELYNRGNAAVDLSGFRFEGIEFTMPAGATLAPGGYLVIAKDPAVMARDWSVEALGPFAGALSNDGENLRLLDRLENPVDAVRYFDGGQWSPWADGGGSSLERIDPDQDGSLGSAWDGSDESSKAVWQQLSFEVPAYVEAVESELHIYLIERGAWLIDDVSIRRGGGANLVPNPGFEASTAPWIIGGTHIQSGRVTFDKHAGSACLQVVATGKGDTLVNRIEVETNPRMTPGAYTVSLWARWLRGSSLLIAHGEYSAGPFRTAPCITCGVAAPNLSGNPLAAALRAAVPLDLGTPGRENSARTRLRSQTGSGNLGPAIGEVRHRPASPEVGQPVAVTARIVDTAAGGAGGIDAAAVFYRLDSAAGVFDSVPLADDGRSDDGEAGDGVFGGQLPGFPLLSRVVFYVEARDVQGAARRFPADAPKKTCLYQVQGAVPGRLDRFSIILDAQRTAELQNRQLHSNDLLSGAFVFEDEEVHYDVGVRYRGSPWGRPSRLSYRVRCAEDDRFRARVRDVNLSKTGAGPGEGASMFFIGRNARPGKASPWTKYEWVSGWLNGASLGTKGLIEAVDGDFMEEWYGEGSRGPLLKAFGRFVFTDGGGLTGQQGWEGASLIWRGENPENYRGYYVHSMEQGEDDWGPLIELTRLLDPALTPNAVLDARVGDWIDLERFLRLQSARVLQGDGDAYLINNGHNGYIAFDSLQGRWSAVPFDTEAAWGSGGFDLFTSLDPAVTRLLSRPGPRRTYLRILDEFAKGYWTTAVSKPFLDALQRATGFGTGSFTGFISGSNARVKTTVQPFLTTVFRIITNGGRDMITDLDRIDLEGDASIGVETLLYRRNGGELLEFAALWTTVTRWKASFDLPEAENRIEILGFDAAGKLLGTSAIAVRTSAERSFIRGDGNRDQAIDLSDPLGLLFHLFAGVPLACRDAADFDDGGSLGISDAIAALEYLFRGGPPPAAPFPAAGLDPTREDALDC